MWVNFPLGHVSPVAMRAVNRVDLSCKDYAMMKTPRLPSLEVVKRHAKRLRAALEETTVTLSHAESLEMIARQWGFSDWNTLCAMIKKQNSPSRLKIGDDISGEYLGQVFHAMIVDLVPLADEEIYIITLAFDKPLTVSNAHTNENLQNRITCTIGPGGKTVEKQACGAPVLQIHFER